MFYPPAIREDATPSSEVRDAPEEVEVASPGAAPVITSPKVPAKENGPSGATGTDDPVSYIEGPVILVGPRDFFFFLGTMLCCNGALFE